MLSSKPLRRPLAPPILSQLVLTTTPWFFVVNPSEKNLGFSDSLFYYDSNDIILPCRPIPLAFVLAFRPKPHSVVFVVNGETKFFLGFLLVWLMLSFKPLMRPLAPPVLSQLVLTTTSWFFVVSRGKFSCGFSDSSTHCGANGVTLLPITIIVMPITALLVILFIHWLKETI